MSCSRSCTFKHQSQGLGPENEGYFPATSPYTGTSFLLPVQPPPLSPTQPPRPQATARNCPRPPSSAPLSARGSSDAQLAQLPPPGTQFASLTPTHFQSSAQMSPPPGSLPWLSYLNQGPRLLPLMASCVFLLTLSPLQFYIHPRVNDSGCVLRLGRRGPALPQACTQQALNKC